MPKFHKYSSKKGHKSARKDLETSIKRGASELRKSFRDLTNLSRTSKCRSSSESKKDGVAFMRTFKPRKTVRHV